MQEKGELQALLTELGSELQQTKADLGEQRKHTQELNIQLEVREGGEGGREGGRRGGREGGREGGGEGGREGGRGSREGGREVGREREGNRGNIRRN